MAQQKTKERLIEVALSQVGYKENPPGSNKNKYGKAYGLDGEPWCMEFVWWCFKEAGFNVFTTASCTTMVERYKKAGQFTTYGIKPGDIVMFDFSGKKKIYQHVGIVEKVVDGWVYTIEGNTSVTSNDNGGAVMQRKRNPKLISGVCHPLYNM